MLPVEIEGKLINRQIRRGGIGLAMIDFDGTVSLLREGWDRVMVPMMVEVLLPLPGTKGTQEELGKEVRDWVLKLNGQPTIDQMAALGREVENRGGKAEPAVVYKQRYLDRLMVEVDRRKLAIKTGECRAKDWVVPGSYSLLETLRKHRVPMMLASGTDLGPLREEVVLLGVNDYFDQGIFGPEEDATTFTKARAADEVLCKLGLPGTALLNVGDGYVETRLTNERGGVAVGVAYDPDRPGEYNGWREEQLRAAGADIIVPDLRRSEMLVEWLMG